MLPTRAEDLADADALAAVHAHAAGLQVPVGGVAAVVEPEHDLVAEDRLLVKAVAGGSLSGTFSVTVLSVSHDAPVRDGVHRLAVGEEALVAGEVAGAAAALRRRSG